jgi:transposase
MPATELEPGVISVQMKDAGSDRGECAVGIDHGNAEGAAILIPVQSGGRVWIATGQTDMRRGMNGLALQVQEGLQRDPHGGDFFCVPTSPRFVDQGAVA